MKVAFLSVSKAREFCVNSGFVRNIFISAGGPGSWVCCKNDHENIRNDLGIFKDRPNSLSFERTFLVLLLSYLLTS